jgi:hypothetical protein
MAAPARSRSRLSQSVTLASEPTLSLPAGADERHTLNMTGLMPNEIFDHFLRAADDQCETIVIEFVGRVGD